MNRDYRGLALAGVLGFAYLFSGCDRGMQDDSSASSGEKEKRAESRQSSEYHCGRLSVGRFELNVTKKGKVYNSRLDFINDERCVQLSVTTEGVPLYAVGEFNVLGAEAFSDGKIIRKFERGNMEGCEDEFIRDVVLKNGEGATGIDALVGPGVGEVLDHVRNCKGESPCRSAFGGMEVRGYENKKVFSGKVSGGSSALDEPVGD